MTTACAAPSLPKYIHLIVPVWEFFRSEERGTQKIKRRETERGRYRCNAKREKYTEKIERSIGML